MVTCLVIPDIQAKPGQSYKHLEALQRFIAKKRPSCIVQLGDLWDIPSLSSYDVGKKSAEGKRLVADINAGKKAVDLITPKIRGYKPKLIYTEGNHEYRIRRYENDYPALEGSLFCPVAYMESQGWDSYPFLAVARWQFH